jgi:hypothetical protein
MMDNTTSQWTTQNGVKGRRFTGPNGNSLFLPAAGYRSGDELSSAGSYVSYWSRSLSPNYDYYAYDLYFDLYIRYRNNYYYRYYGLSVRAVCP